MAIAFEGTATLYENASTTSAALTYPSSPASGEILVAVLGTSTVTAPTTAPSGWTLAKAQNGDNAISGSIFYKISDGTESGTVTFTGMSGRTTGHMFRLSGVDNTTPIDVAGVGAGVPIQTTFDMPSITTATANAWLVHGIVLNASNRATNDINTLSGTTLQGISTGTGRVTGAYTELRATAGATGTRTWTKTGATALQWAGATVAFRPAAGGTTGDVTAVVATATAEAIAPAVSDGNSGNVASPAATATATAPAPAVAGGVVPVLVRMVQGIPTTTTHIMKVNTTGASSVRIKAGTNSGVTTGVVWGDAITPDGNSNSELTISGLTAGTAYFYRIAMTDAGGQEHLDAWSAAGEFKTDTAGQYSFSFAFASCDNTNDSTGSASLSAIATKKPDLLFHLGDEYYFDGSGTSVSNIRSKMAQKLECSNYKSAYRVSGAHWIPSDHDAMNNNGNAAVDPTAWANWNQVYREMKPAAGLPTVGVARSFKRGRVRFIAMDRRSGADNPADTDNSSKTSLDATQRAWLETEVNNATEQVIVLMTDCPWIITTDTGDDGWGGFITERDSIASFLSGTGKNIVMLAGDMHAVAAEDGSGAPGGVAVFQAAPFYQNASIKGGPYDVGPYPASGTSVVQQYGWVDVVDTGSNIDVVFKGFSSDNTQRVTLTKSYSVPTPGDVAAVTATATATAIAPAVVTPVAPAAMTATATAVAPAVTALAVVQAVTATATATAYVPTVETPVAPAAMTATATALAPAVTVPGDVAGVLATAAAEALAPVVVGAAEVVGVLATATADALAPVVSAGGVGDVAAVTATATADALAPVVTAGQVLTAPAATATADALAPVVAAAATVAAVLATATADTVAPAVETPVGAPAATATADAVVPVVTAAVEVVAVLATATADALAPLVTAAGEGVVSAPAATATAEALAPVLAVASIIAATCGTADAGAQAPAVTGAVDVAAVVATATADAPAPAVNAGSQTVVEAVVATAVADALAPVVSAAVVVAAVAATATALAHSPAVVADVAVAAAVGLATAQALAPAVTAGAVAYVPTAEALAEALAPLVATVDQSDIVLRGTALAVRWRRSPAPANYEMTEWPDRFTGRPDTGGRMAVEVLATAGAVKFVGGTVTETSGADISGATFEMSLGSATYPGSTWYAPDVSAAGASNAERVLKLKVSSSLPAGLTVPGVYWCWVRITDASEVEPVRLQGPITVR